VGNPLACNQVAGSRHRSRCPAALFLAATPLVSIPRPARSAVRPEHGHQNQIQLCLCLHAAPSKALLWIGCNRHLEKCEPLSQLVKTIFGKPGGATVNHTMGALDKTEADLLIPRSRGDIVECT
jgi:hypothetical protein